MKNYDVVVVGGGPSGHSCAVRLAQQGASVAVVERDFIGGICVNWGCTPSKAMIESAKYALHVADSDAYGVEVSDFQINFQKIAARRNKVVVAARESIEDLLRHHKIDIYQGEGLLQSASEVFVRGGKLDIDGETMHYTAEEFTLKTKHIVMATGSAPLVPRGIDPNHPKLINSNRLISIDERPDSLTIVGGGVIGVEFATIFSNLGTKVTIIEFLDRLLPMMDAEISSEITRILEANGVHVLTGHQMTAIDDTGVVEAENRVTGTVVNVASEMTLLSIGRKAVVDGSLCERLGLAYSPRGIEVDEYLRTNVSGIWAVGDATGQSILAHVGIQQGLVAAENIMKAEGEALRPMDYSVIPAVVYSLPEIVSVGIVPQDLSGVKVIKVPFSANLRANIEEHTDGFLKLWIKGNLVLAAQAIGNNVSELIQELSNMIALKTPIEEVAEIIHPHPTYAEIIRSALEYSLDQAVDFYL